MPAECPVLMAEAGPPGGCACLEWPARRACRRWDAAPSPALHTQSTLTPDQIQRFVEHASSLMLVVRPDERYTILAASDAYLRATHTDREIGRAHV